MDCLIGFCQRAQGKKNPYVIMPFGPFGARPDRLGSAGKRPRVDPMPRPGCRSTLLACLDRPAATEPLPSAALDPGRGQRAPLTSCRHAGDEGSGGRAAWTVRVGGAARRAGAGSVGGMAGVAGLRGEGSLGGARGAHAHLRMAKRGPRQRCSVMEAPERTCTIEQPG